MTPPGTSSGAGGRRFALALVAVVAALVALVLLALREDAPVTTPEPPPAPEQDRSTARPAVPRTATDGPSRAETAVAPSPVPEERPQTDGSPTVVAARTEPLRLHVVVVRASGAPAAGAEVLALDPLGEYLRPPSPVVRERRTADADGKADFEIRGGTTVTRVLATLEGEAALSGALGAEAGREQTVRLELRAGLAVRCRVADPDGAAIPGAWVRLTMRSALRETWSVVLAMNVDAEGVAAFPALPVDEEGDVTLVAGARRHLTQGEAYRVPRLRAALRAWPVELRLPRGVSVRGRAVDEQGRPVPNAVARVLGQGSGEAADAEGRFDVAALPTTGGTLWVHREDFAPTLVRDLRGDAGDVDVGDVVLRPGGRIAGVVVGSDGNPVAAARVHLFHEGDPDELLAATETGDDGRFAFDRVPEGPLRVDAAEPPLASSGAAAIHARAGGLQPGATELRLVLSGAASVHVRFLSDAQRAPVVVTSVKLTARAVGDTPSELAWAWSGGNIDAVRFEPEHTGRFDVTVEVPGYLPATAEGVDVLPDRETRIDVLFRRE